MLVRSSALSKPYYIIPSLATTYLFVVMSLFLYSYMIHTYTFICEGSGLGGPGFVCAKALGYDLVDRSIL